MDRVYTDQVWHCQRSLFAPSLHVSSIMITQWSGLKNYIDHISDRQKPGTGEILLCFSNSLKGSYDPGPWTVVYTLFLHFRVNVEMHIKHVSYFHNSDMPVGKEVIINFLSWYTSKSWTRREGDYQFCSYFFVFTWRPVTRLSKRCTSVTQCRCLTEQPHWI